MVDIDNIRSSYPIAKRAAEMLCKAYSTEYSVDSVIVRPGHIFGHSASHKDNRVSSDFLFKAAKGENLIMRSAGNQKRSYCYSIDAATAVIVALLYGEKGEAYNIGHNDVTSIREMAETVARAGSVKLSIALPSENESKVFNPIDNSSLNNEKIKGIGYKDCFTIEEGLSHTVQILREIL